MKRFPGFELDLFPKLTQEDLNQMADEISRVCCPDLLVEPVEVLSIEVSTHYRTPAWWDASFYTGQQPTEEQEQQSTNRPR